MEDKIKFVIFDKELREWVQEEFGGVLEKIGKLTPEEAEQEQIKLIKELSKTPRGLEALKAIYEKRGLSVIEMMKRDMKAMKENAAIGVGKLEPDGRFKCRWCMSGEELDYLFEDETIITIGDMFHASYYECYVCGKKFDRNGVKGG